MKSFLKKCPIIIPVIALVITMLVKSPTPISQHCMAAVAINFAKAVVVTLLTWLVVGKDYLNTPGKGWSVLLRYGKGILFITIALLVVTLVTGSNDASYSTKVIVCAAIMAICVGIIEEGVFRRGMFVTLARMIGQKNKAVLISAVISSLIFGLAHVILNLSFTSSGIISEVAKIVETGVFGFIMCSMIYDSRNFWVVVFVHAFFDFSGLMTSMATTPTTAAVGSYVANDMVSAAIMAGANFAILLFEIPAFIHSIKVLKNAENNL